jgi:hypothetical protein
MHPLHRQILGTHAPRSLSLATPIHSSTPRFREDTADSIVHHVVRANLAGGLDTDIGSGDSIRVQFGTLGGADRRIGYVAWKRACVHAVNGRQRRVARVDNARCVESSIG